MRPAKFSTFWTTVSRSRPRPGARARRQPHAPTPPRVPANAVPKRVDLEGLALRRAIELGDGHWEERVRTAHDALAATPLPPRGEPGPSFERWRMLHQQFHLAIKALDDHLALTADIIIDSIGS